MKSEHEDFSQAKPILEFTSVFTHEDDVALFATLNDVWPRMKTDVKGNKIWRNKNGDWHRENGPAMEFYWGDTEWWLNGVVHRTDGPAIEGPRSGTQWYISDNLLTEEEFHAHPDCTAWPRMEINKAGNKVWKNKEGQLDREDGPAIEGKFRDFWWYINGELHRVDGAALEWHDGYKEWHINGVKLTEEEFYAHPDCTAWPRMKVDECGTKYWTNKEGQHHRSDGPARECADGHKEWLQNNKLHRLDGPAIIYANGQCKEEYWINNNSFTEEEFHAHPDCTAWPRRTGNGNEWEWKNKEGQLHRLDGPAFKNPVMDKWYKNGKLHRTDGHADNFYFTHGVESNIWHINGEELYEEEFYAHPECTAWPRRIDLENGHYMTIDKTGNKYWHNKMAHCHRTDGPAKELIDGTKEWYINGRNTRTDGPAI